jgi:hypothetical protein
LTSQQANEANDARADETNDAIGAGLSVEAIDSDNEDGVFGNQLAELEILDAASKAIVSNEVGKLSELTVTNNDELIVARSGELDEFIEAAEAV